MASDILGCATEMAAASSDKPQDGLDKSREARTRQLLNSSKSQIAFQAEEVKKLRMENTRVATTLMKKEKVHDQEVEDWIQKQDAVKKS